MIIKIFLSFPLARLVIIPSEPKPLCGWSHILFSTYLTGHKINYDLYYIYMYIYIYIYIIYIYIYASYKVFTSRRIYFIKNCIKTLFSMKSFFIISPWQWVHFLLYNSSFITRVWTETIYQNKNKITCVLSTKPILNLLFSF